MTAGNLTDQDPAQPCAVVALRKTQNFVCRPLLGEQPLEVVEERGDGRLAVRQETATVVQSVETQSSADGRRIGLGREIENVHDVTGSELEIVANHGLCLMRQILWTMTPARPRSA
jgi:hypothetical protein